MTDMQKRTVSPETKGTLIKYISYLQIIGIVLVVFGHSFHEYPDGSQGKALLVYTMCHSFRMPLFMFVSGFLMVFTSFISGKKPTPSIRIFVLNKTKRLLLPFFVLTLVTFVPRAGLSFMADDEMTLGLEPFIKAFVYQECLPNPILWFLQASFILLVFTYCFIYLMRKSNVRPWVYNIALIVIFIIFPLVELPSPHLFSIREAANLGIFFASGAVYAHYERTVDRKIDWASPIVFILCAALWASLFFLSGQNGLAYTGCSLAGIAMCIALSHWLVKKNIKFLDHLSGANYIIFLLSWYFNVASQQVLHYFVSFPWPVYTILSIFSGIYVPWLFYQWMLRHKDASFVKACAFLLGQNLRKKSRTQK